MNYLIKELAIVARDMFVAGLRKDCLALALKTHHYERGLDEHVEATADAFFRYATKGQG